MGTVVSRPRRRWILAGIAGLFGYTTAGICHAQFATSLPYSPYSSQNLAFSYPTVVNPSLPNQTRLLYGAPNQFPAYSLDLGAQDSTSGLDILGSGRAARGTPYYNTARIGSSTSKFKEIEGQIAEYQGRRDTLYLQLAQEQDPEKRDAIKKELKDVNAALDKELGRTKRRTGDIRTSGAGNSGGRSGSTQGTSRGSSLGLPRHEQNRVSDRHLLEDDMEVGGVASRTTLPGLPASRTSESSVAGAPEREMNRDAVSQPDPAADSGNSTQPKKRVSLSETATMNSLRNRGLGSSNAPVIGPVIGPARPGQITTSRRSGAKTNGNGTTRSKPGTPESGSKPGTSSTTLFGTRPATTLPAIETQEP